MIKIIKYYKSGCTPCLTQSAVLRQLSERVHFELEEINVLEMDQALLAEKDIRGVPYLEIYWDDELLYNKAGLIREDKLMEILLNKLA